MAEQAQFDWWLMPILIGGVVSFARAADERLGERIEALEREIRRLSEKFDT
jgi:hypothetical protein